MTTMRHTFQYPDGTPVVGAPVAIYLVAPGGRETLGYRDDIQIGGRTLALTDGSGEIEVDLQVVDSPSPAVWVAEIQPAGSYLVGRTYFTVPGVGPAQIADNIAAAPTTSTWSVVGVEGALTGTAAELASSNPVLVAGRHGYATDSGEMGIGDGVTTWSLLPKYRPSTADLYDHSVLSGQVASIPNTGTQLAGLAVSYDSDGSEVQVEAIICGSFASAGGGFPRIVIYDEDDTTIRGFHDGASAYTAAASCGPIHVVTKPFSRPAGTRTFHVWAYRQGASGTVTVGLVSGDSISLVRPAIAA
jgi:hypothetical protein